MGKAARKGGEMVYHWDRLVEQLMDIYEESLEANGNV